MSWQEDYSEHGYVGPVQVLNAEDTRRFVEQADEHIRSTSSRRQLVPIDFVNWHLELEWAAELARHPGILDQVECILGPRIVHWRMNVWLKEPQTGGSIPWHQDSAYWVMNPRITCTVWLALGDCDSENGCLAVVPGSHRNGLKHQWTDADDSMLPLEAEGDWSDKAIELPAQSGEAIIFDQDLVHGSKSNRSPRKRVGCALRYTTPEVNFDLENWLEKVPPVPVMVRG
jgi:non-haem Fe2+, alpha-ketoglutarate-dependent halogenase